MSNYIISAKALNDINKVWIYPAENWSVDQANRYYNLIFDEIEFVAQNFEAANDFGDTRENYRYLKVKSHLIFFRKIKNNKIEVVRVLHQKMNVNKRLAD